MGVFRLGSISSEKMTLGKYLDAIKFTLWTLLSIAFLTSYRYEVGTTERTQFKQAVQSRLRNRVFLFLPSHPLFSDPVFEL